MPRRRSRKLTDADLSFDGSPYGSLVKVKLNCGGDEIDATLFRISYVGDTGWEIYVAWDDAPKLWDALMEAGADLGIRPTGGGVYGTSGRIEKGYRLHGCRTRERVQPARSRPCTSEGEVGRLHRQGRLPEALVTPVTPRS